MKGDWAVISVLSFAFALFMAALGADIVLWSIGIIADWLRELPAPTEHFASLLGDWAWPLAALLIAYLLRRPLRVAAGHLARRLQKDRIKLAGILEVDAATSLITLDEGLAAEPLSTFSPRDVKVIESMWEFVGESDENWSRLLSWIPQRVPNLEVEDFLSERIFAPMRELAYRELVEVR
jgi:hypothetical protein